ncbi:uncharacterized protein LOC117505495 [Thalassophryne amazonica]|uniref:uncharacterized protein LOC117505495 n=1 Tax=Thalassophryne amazonica TaxID=390379 RepID=UPI001470D14A|nr:uncharacterized protein LOC117505495 [Thalassophryne amazonica]
MSQRCALLMGAPFTTCNIDPQPYIQACNYTLCRYPAVDGLKCTFMEAYARDCRIRRNTMMDGWRSSVSCPGPQAFCQGRFCSDHEFCGETRCFCRAIFASQYGSPFEQSTVCIENTASVTFVGCLLEDFGIDYTALHLKDETCKGQVDNMTHTVSFTFDGHNTCGTVVTVSFHCQSNPIFQSGEHLLTLLVFVKPFDPEGQRHTPNLHEHHYVRK